MDCLPIDVGSRLRTASIIRLLPFDEEGFLQGIDCLT
jgi:hypothetical protein